MRILIGYNGSEAAKAALYDLCRAGFPDNTEALILTVAEPLLFPNSAAEASSIAEVAKAILCREFPTWKVNAETGCGVPPREILARAESFEADVIVVGEPLQLFPHGSSFYGHISHTILADAGCSVRIARGNENKQTRPLRLLVGFDGSAGAAHTVDAIAKRQWPSETAVRLLAVADSSVLSSIGRFTPQMNDAAVEARLASQWAEALAAASLEKLRHAGILASVEVRFGHPSEIIVDEAKRWNADTIFVGPHCAPSATRRLLIGSVSSGVAARANATVEVVR
jgi:nucleotide-binding universal stress UspA family protein